MTAAAQHRQRDILIPLHQNVPNRWAELTADACKSLLANNGDDDNQMEENSSVKKRWSITERSVEAEVETVVCTHSHKAQFFFKSALLKGMILF